MPFSVDSAGAFDAAVDTVIASLGDGVELLGFGEALHGGEELLILRNRLFQLRSRGTTNPSYVTALTPQSLTDFDWLAVLDETGYSRGAPSWWQRDADPAE